MTKGWSCMEGSTVKQWHCMTSSCSSPLEAISGRTEGRWVLLASCTDCHREHLVSKTRITLLSTDRTWRQ